MSKKITKLTKNKHYNVYECLNVGGFATFPYYVVGKDDYKAEFTFSFRKDIAETVCAQLEQEEIVKIAKELNDGIFQNNHETTFDQY